jgi:hypothetical protein
VKSSYFRIVFPITLLCLVEVATIVPANAQRTRSAQERTLPATSIPNREAEIEIHVPIPRSHPDRGRVENRHPADGIEIFVPTPQANRHRSNATTASTRHNPANNTPTTPTPTPNASARDRIAAIPPQYSRNRPPLRSTRLQYAPFPRFQMELADRSGSDSDFASFRDRVKTAVAKRDVRFIKSSLAANANFGFGGAISFDQLRLDNAQSPTWKALEKTFGLGCAPQGASDAGWVCPSAVAAWRRVTVEHHDHAVVTGTNVIARSAPREDAESVGELSNEVVRVLQRPANNNAPEWTAVVLASGKPAYILDRHLYSPAEYRVTFRKINGEWKITGLLAGD